MTEPSQILRIIEKCRKHLAAGKNFRDALVIAQYPKLMPDLGKALRDLRKEFQASTAASDTQEVLDELKRSEPLVTKVLPPFSIELVVEKGPHQGSIFRFDRHDTFYVGRGKQAHFRLPDKDPFFSRLHFMVEVNPPACRVMDLGSLNGTFVNHNKIEINDLHDGDRIYGGDTVFLVRLRRQQSRPVNSSHPSIISLPAEQVASNDNPSTMCVRPIDKFPVAESPGVKSSSADLANKPCPVCTKVASSSHRLPYCDTCRESLRTEQFIAGYDIFHEIGRGGFGVVYLAWSHAEQVPVAVKTISPVAGHNPGDVDRFFRETLIVQSLRHPNIVGFRQRGQAGGQLFLAMDYVRGVDCHKLVNMQGPIDPARAVKLICQVLEGLQAAHEKGFVHRDLKPSNIMVGDVGQNERAMIADFGLAKVYLDSSLSGLSLGSHKYDTPSGLMIGSEAFCPPEQILSFSSVSSAGDIYSLAATLYYMLTAQPIYDFPEMIGQRLMMVVSQPPIPLIKRNPKLGKALNDVVMKALSHISEDRYASANEMRLALLKAIGK